jgi:fucose permease
VLCAIPLAIVGATRFPTPKHAQGFPLAAAKGLLRDPILLTFGVMLFLESGMEITIGGWTSTFFKEELQVADQRALVYLSLYWLGMTIGRMALSGLVRLVSPSRLLFGGVAVAFGGALLLITTRDPTFAAVGVFLLGLGFAATFPVVLGFVADRYAALSGTAFSVMMVMALTGGMLVPYATGVLGTSYGLRGSFLIVPTALAFFAALLGITSSRLARQASPAA